MKKRTKRGRAQDRKRIALTQKHERNYLLTCARKLIKLCETDKKQSKIYKMRSYVELFTVTEKGFVRFSTSTLKRLARALIKCLK